MEFTIASSLTRLQFDDRIPGVLDSLASAMGEIGFHPMADATCVA